MSLTKSFFVGGTMSFLSWLGEPFNWKPGTSTRGWEPEKLKREYDENKSKHYAERILSCVGILVLGIAALFLTWLSSGWLLLLIPVVLVGFTAVDVILYVARFAYREKVMETYASRNEIVPIGFFKDTTLESLLAERLAQRAEFEKNYAERHNGRQPSFYDY